MTVNLSTERRQGERRIAKTDGLWKVDEFNRRSAGRRAIERMAATPAELDRFARRAAAIEKLGVEEYYDEIFEPNQEDDDAT